MNGATGMQLGRYLLRQRLGTGGMATVWTAVDERGRTVVVKRLLPALADDAEFADMFAREAELSARLRHPNIVRVFDHGDYEGERYLVMELLRGQDLGSTMQALAPRGAPRPAFGAFVAREVARALAYLHALKNERGASLSLIHRDISLSNVMLGYDGTVKLLDFGVAKSLAEERTGRTQVGVLKGKWAYLSPEQIEGATVDQRADLFALGIVLFETLTARRLFKAPTGLETLERVRAARVLPPSTLNPAVPPELDAICGKLLARQPADRWQTAAEVAQALDEVVARLGFGGPELALELRALFPAAAAAHDEATLVTPPDGEAALPFDDGDTQLSPAGVTLQALRRRRRTGGRLALVAAIALALGGITGWQLGRARAVERLWHTRLQVAAKGG